MNGPLVVRLARSWIGTPYVHQQSSKGAGCDCLGLLRGIWAELGLSVDETVPPYTMDWAESSGEEVLWRAAQRNLKAKSLAHAEIGDVLLFRMASGAVAKHLGIQSEIGPAPRFVHSYSGHGVVESSLSEPWRRRIVARFEFPQRPEEGA